MSSGSKDRVKGAFHEAKGKVKEVAGTVTDNPKLHAKGVVEKLAGQVQEKLGKVKKALTGRGGA